MENKNLNIRINLGAMKSAGVVMLEGKTGIKKCIVIPIDDNHLYQGNKGVYLDLVAWSNDKLADGKTHLIKQSLSREIREAMTEEERRAQPTFGDVQPMISEMERSDASTELAEATMTSADPATDLPF